VLRAVIAFGYDESGATAIEYALLGMLVAMGAIVAFGTFGNGLALLFGSSETGAGAHIEDAAGRV
jgi:pilus assembly protein Flp/PilA